MPDGPASSFEVVDYVVFAFMLAVSAAIGLHSWWSRRGSSDSSEFLTGGRKMGALPVSMSLAASFMSSVTLVSIPAEVYRFGSIFALLCFGYFFAILISSEIFLPVFYRLEIRSIYEYLELRFNRATRLLGTVMSIVHSVLYTGFVIYAPALALGQLAGMNVWIGIVLTAGICTIYCTLGGLKAVIWTDVFQIGIMIAGYLAIMIKSLIRQGGISTILADAQQGGRFNAWDFDPNPFRRHTFWTVIIGGTIGWVGVYGTNQAQVQRYNACRSITHARLALHINLLGLWAIMLSTMFAGLCTYSILKHCDPLSAGLVAVPDELLPYMVKLIMVGQHGLLGLFFSAVYSGSLSTVSSSINALAAVTLEDLVKPYTSMSEKHLFLVSKGLTFFYGVVCIAMAALASVMGQMSQAVSIVGAVTGGPLTALFALGILCPSINTKGALSGLLVGLGACLCLAVGGMVCPTRPEMSRPLPVSTEGCNLTTAPLNLNWTATVPPTTPIFTTMPLTQSARCTNWQSPSYLYIGLIAVVTVTFVGLVVSLMTGGRKQTVDPRFILQKEDMLSYRLFKRLRERVSTTKEHQHDNKYSRTHDETKF
ncbi:unnamed protein product [Ophioblennius macclurei]